MMMMMMNPMKFNPVPPPSGIDFVTETPPPLSAKAEGTPAGTTQLS